MKVLLRDCLDLLAELQDDSVDLVLIDPPFCMGDKPFINEDLQYKRVNEPWDNQWANKSEYAEWCSRWAYASARKLAAGGSMLVFSSFHSNAILQRALDGSGLIQRNFVTWFVPNATPILRAKQMGSYAHSCLYIFYYSKGPVKFFDYEYLKRLNGGSQHRDLIVMERCPHSERLGHPTQKSLKLIAQFVRTHCAPGGLVVDFFMGSGTTAEAAITSGRDFVGGDTNPYYYQMTVDRLLKLKQDIRYSDLPALKELDHAD
jgi:site-specific DNA-methyltransferase (adenine-specific)